ncbi:MAG TPA: sigma 54-interacting transcriptional regulator [Acidobacteriaceae bacterium]|jgi:transcriptional regulator with GAF, ATPase, and Fis domain|nr:sigma 54-interacting transcriptional regulator [Acidobacteriaceae bacterium]
MDVRLVAATNRNLVKMVARGQFRSDLYYRLNVFPILLPALRERREDIPALVTHFVKMFSRRTGKQVDSIPQETMAAFQCYSWPGNIRELQNLVERGSYPSGRNRRSRIRARSQDLRVELAVSHGIRLELSKRERLERQTLVDRNRDLEARYSPDTHSRG